MVNQGSALDRALHHDDMNAVREMIEEIERRKLQRAYMVALMNAVEPNVTIADLSDVLMPMWRLLNATPAQHARAFIASTQSP